MVRFVCPYCGAKKVIVGSYVHIRQKIHCRCGKVYKALLVNKV